MTNSKQTKKALLSSVIALVLCLSMLIGTTFAWFTDTVSSDLNEIKAGNLDIELDYWNGSKWNTVQGEDDLFTGELWEPGHTEVVYLRLTNAGTLALKWQLGINVAAEQGSISVAEGNPAFKLSDFIKFGVVEGVNGETSAYAEREDAIDDLDEAKIKKLNASYSDKGHMSAGDVKYIAVVVYMPETVGNEANYKKGAPVPTIDLGIKLYATQKDEESDSFGNDYDKKASLTVTEDSHKNGTLTLAQAIAQVEDGGIVFVESGTYTIGSVITITGKSLSVIGLGDVQLEYAQTGGTHFFNVTSGSNVSFENMTMVNAAKHGIYVRNNSVVTLSDVSVSGSRGSADIMVDEATDAAHGKNTASYVWMYNSSAERVALCASPVTTVAATQDTYVYFNYDAESTVGSIEKQSINKKPENIYINGVNVEGNGMNLYVTNDDELKAALETIKNNSKYHNVQVYVHLAAGEYSADHVINQYPEWNGIVGRNNGNNYQGGVPAGAPSTVITFVGETASTFALRGAQVVPAVIFTGNVTVNGFGDAQSGLDSAVARTTFENVAFANSTKTNANGDIVAVEMTAAAANVTFTGCTFQNAEYVIVGARAYNIVGDMTFDGCTFSDVCISGYVDKTITVKNSTVLNADGGFINNQNNGDIIVDNCTINAGKYFVRTNGSGIEIEVTDSDITVYESEGTKHLVYFRGSSESAEFTDCTIAAGYTTEGVDANSALGIYNYSDVDGVTYVKDAITGENTLYLVPADYEGTTVTVPEGVTAIGNNAFTYNTNVETVILGKDVTDLGRGFDSNTSIKKVVLNEGLTTISSRAFKGTTALEEVVISSTVTEIADNAFQKSGIKKIVIPANVETIGETAFGASLIEEVTFEGDIAIQGYAFRGCPNLRTVRLNGYNVTFVRSTLNGRNSMWFCNGESNNPNTSDIDFYVKNEVIKERVLTAMGAERNNTDVYCEQTAEDGGYYTDDQGNAYAYDGQGLVAALEDGCNVVLCGDAKIDPAGMSNAYGTTGINVKNGQIIDGNGNTLDIKGAGGTWDSGISTTGGVIKNITITGSFRGVFVNHTSTHSERVILENVIIDGTTYTISCDQGMNQGLTATNSTFNGWTSYAATIGDVKFEDCSFGEGNGYAFCRPYAPTEFVGCDFEAGFKIDPIAAIAFENCTIGGESLTADNLETLVIGNVANATVK